MRFLNSIGVRIILAFILSNMLFELAAPDLATTPLSVIFRIIAIGVFYYFLTVYVNSRKQI